MTLTRTMRALGATTLAAGLLLSSAPLASADQVRDGQWPIQQFDLAKAWAVTKGEGVKVAVIDQGVDGTHPDLAGQVLPGYDPGNQGREKAPKVGHGTSMAGVIAGKGHDGDSGVIGVAPGSKIIPIFKSDASGTDAIADGIRWAADHGAKVINISQGAPGAASDEDTAAVAYAVSKDVLVVVAAGNEASSKVSSPANVPGVLAVGAVGKDGKVWSNSNSGPELMLTAPGTEIVSTGSCSGSKYCIADGTSSATAFVSGAAALVRAKFPDLTAGQVANRLVKSAKAPAALGGAKLPDEHYGYGIVRPYEALTQNIPAGSAQGPLAKTAASTGGGTSPSAAAVTPGGAAPGAGAADVAESDGFSFVGKGLAIAAAVLLVLAVLFVVLIVVLVKASRRRRAAAAAQAAPAPYGYPQAQPPYPNQPYGQQPPPPGQPPYGQQPPHQNPYGPGGNQ
ncbi:type VII secretion-associated serine protease mycosin [Kitasatospora sp. NBC_00070]|uniref:type VII secretion-associated serine protease mycosin n=1 Tax=Kitasatospora sp. NBC_00070 TaxID=2975962 RepID=UPI00324AA537